MIGADPPRNQVVRSLTPPEAETDYLLLDWEQAGLRAPSWFRLYLIPIEQP